MTWTWTFAEPLADTDLALDVATGWPDRACAEGWMQDYFADLVESGIHEATLVNDGDVVYTMGLDE